MCGRGGSEKGAVQTLVSQEAERELEPEVRVTFKGPQRHPSAAAKSHLLKCHSLQSGDRGFKREPVGTFQTDKAGKIGHRAPEGTH